MPKVLLSEIEGIGEADLELLSAIGVEDVEELSEVNVGELVTEMAKANALLKLREEAPDRGVVQGWKNGALKLLGKGAGYDPFENVEQDEDLEGVQEEALSESIPMATPVDKGFIVKNRIQVGEVPVMDRFEEVVKREEVVVLEEASEVIPEPEIPSAGRDGSGRGARDQEIRIRRSGETKLPQEYQSLSSLSGEAKEVKPLERKASFDIRKSASPGLNSGKNENQRSYIRGVLHPTPARVKLGAFVSAIMLLMIPISFAAIGLFLWMEEIWLLYIPPAALVFSFFYLTISRPVKCRICGQGVFVPKSCRRHVKAHHIPLLGYILPTSLQILLFHWFRCIYCGTSIRLKE